MRFPASSRALLPSLMAGALVLAGATACSRPDRSESGSDNSTVVTQDTAIAAPGQSSGEGSTTAGTSTTADTTVSAGTGTETGAVTADTASTKIQSNAPRAGYRAMERDTVIVPESDSARVSEDTSETSLNTADTTSVETAAGYIEMARDTSTAADQIDTTGAAVDAGGEIQASVDTTTAEVGVTADADISPDADVAVAAVDTSSNAGRIRPPEDSTETLGQVTTDSTTALATADTVESEHIRPPEDSTEILGSVGDETADEQEVNAAEQEVAVEDRETVATSESSTDDVGAAAIGGAVTGAEAVALMSRQGARCVVVDPETDREVRWDMSSTPVTLNPCGLGSMVLSRIWVRE